MPRPDTTDRTPSSDPQVQGQQVPDLDGPALETDDWDAIGEDELVPGHVSENGDIRYDEDGDGEESLEEDDDNAYQESDEALPDDDEERAIADKLRR